MNRSAGHPLIRALAMVAGVASALALVWFVGPLVAIGGVAPLTGERARWIAVTAVLVLAAAYGLTYIAVLLIGAVTIFSRRDFK